MEIIKNYLETLFLKLPATSEVNRAKSELGQMMEDKYHELLAEGKTENEAIGTVIAEFGNLDELAEDLGIRGILQENSGEKNEQTADYQQSYAYGQTADSQQDFGYGQPDEGQSSYAYGQSDWQQEERRDRHRDVRYGRYGKYGTSGNLYLDSFMSVFWSSVTCVYLIWSFVTFKWWITWIIWPVAGVVHKLLLSIFYDGRDGQ